MPSESLTVEYELTLDDYKAMIAHVCRPSGGPGALAGAVLLGGVFLVVFGATILTDTGLPFLFGFAFGLVTTSDSSQG